MLRLTLEDVLAATRAVAQMTDSAAGALVAARRIRARAEGGSDAGDEGSVTLAAAARRELARSGVKHVRPLGQRRLLRAAAAVCAVMAAANPKPGSTGG